MLTLALGIGVNTAIFSLVEALLLRPLPFPAAERLIAVDLKASQGRRTFGSPWSWPQYVDLTRVQRSYQSIAAWTPAPVSLTNTAQPERLVSEQVTASYFRDARGVGDSPPGSAMAQRPYRLVGRPPG